MDPFGIESYIQRRLNEFFGEPSTVIPSITSGNESNSSQLVQAGSSQIAPLRSSWRNVGARLDVSETADAVKVSVELPGVKKEDVQVHLDENILSIQAERKEERKEESDRYYYSERSFGKIQRQVRLPNTVDAERVRSRFENGVLQLELAKKTPDAGRKRIQI